MSDPSGLDVLGRMLPSLALIVGALLLVRRWAQRGGRALGDSGVRVLGRTAVTRNAVVAVVEIAGRRFLVGAGDQSVTLLSELDPAAPVGGPTIPLSAGTDVAPARPAMPSDRPWMGLIHRLQLMTVRTALPKADPHARMS
jgi:flagellar biosynthetic protein FliO